jgi:hypothetical protein
VVVCCVEDAGTVAGSVIDEYPRVNDPFAVCAVPDGPANKLAGATGKLADGDPLLLPSVTPPKMDGWF